MLASLRWADFHCGKGSSQRKVNAMVNSIGVIESTAHEINERKDRIKCWSCKSDLNIADLERNDGLCLFCNVEIDLEDE